MKYNDLINELLDLLDENSDIKKVKSLKDKLISNKELTKDIENYKLIKTVDNKKKLYTNQEYLEYLSSEVAVNLLIEKIKKKFSVFSSRKCS